MTTRSRPLTGLVQRCRAAALRTWQRLTRRSPIRLARPWMATLVCLPALAQPAVPLDAQAHRLDASPHLEYVFDTGRRWSGSEPPPADAGWRPLTTHAGRGNFGHVKHPVWMRARLENRDTAPATWRWIVRHPTLLTIDLWARDPATGATRHWPAGLQAMAEGRAVRQRLPALPLVVPARGALEVLMRVDTQATLRAPVDLMPEAAWQADDRWSHALLGGYFGLLLGLMAYNAVLWWRLKDAAYGFYVGFGAGIALYQLGSTGLGPIHAWPALAPASADIMLAAAAACGTFALLFANAFLRLGEVAPRLSRVLRVAAALWALVLLANVWVPIGDLTRWVVMPLTLACLGLLVVSGVLGWRRQVPAAPVFLLGWSGIVLAGGMRALLVQHWLSASPLVYNALLIASATEMVLLSFALADRIAAERRARAEADLRHVRELAAREQAQRALDEKSRFMAAITHDLQQPLYALRLATEGMARRGAGHLPPQALDQMQSALFSAEELMASLAMSVRLDRENLQPAFAVFSVQDMLERIDTLFATRAQQSGLRWRVLPSLALVHSDPAMLERMVCNLVSNAMRYTSRGGVLLSCRERASHLLIQVWDTGAGIPEAEQATIFEPYRRGSAARSDDEGLGLGLSIVGRCAQQLGVRVGLRSVPGRGSCFALWVPRAPADA